MMMPEQCVFCGHKHLVSKEIRYIYQKDGQMLVVEHVPCTECVFCGEQYFDAVVLQKIELEYLAISQQQKHPQRMINVAVQEFAGI